MTAEGVRPGTVIDGRYRLERVLDRGGQAAIYRALDLQVGDSCAVKMLKPEFVADADSRERLLREARALVTLQGTAAVRVLDQRWHEGQPCVVMELLEGVHLEQYLQERAAPMSASEVGAMLEPIAETLHAAHQHAIIHRDVKPSNVFLTQQGGVRLIDFGFAKFTQLLGLTASGSAAGSPSYMAPEIWNGAAVDHRIDIYSLGVLVFVALGGRTPFDSTNLVTLWRNVTTAPRPSLHALRPDLDPAVDAWVRQAMAIDPSDRFTNIRAAWQAFRSAAGT